MKSEQHQKFQNEISKALGFDCELHEMKVITGIAFNEYRFTGHAILSQDQSKKVMDAINMDSSDFGHPKIIFEMRIYGRDK